MFRIRPSQSRGHFNHGWLDTYHTFSFGDYFDPEHVNFRALRVMNEDRIAPGQGFGMHGHRDMEIVTYVLSGALAHRDSLGNGEALHPGEFQHMSAGTGIRHSEFNPNEAEPVHLYQIWLLPEKNGLPPSYGQRAFDAAGRQRKWQLTASPDGRDGSLVIRQDAEIYLATLEHGEDLSFSLPAGRHAWLQVLRGGVQLNGQPLQEGDGVAISEEPALSVRADTAAEVMLFNLA